MMQKKPKSLRKHHRIATTYFDDGFLEAAGVDQGWPCRTAGVVETSQEDNYLQRSS